MTDRYDELRVSPDPSRAEELRQRLHAELERSSLDDAIASRRRLTIASPVGGAEFRPMEEMHMSDYPADREHKTRWRTPAVAAAAIVVLGVGAIAFAVSNTNADDPDGVPQAPAPTAAPTTPAPTTTVAPLIVTYTGIPGVPITYTVPDGWDPPEDDGFVVFGESSMVNFQDVANVYADGCEHTLLVPPLGPAVDDLATCGPRCPVSPRRHPSTSPSTGTPANRSTSPSPTTRPRRIRPPARTRPTVSTASSPSGMTRVRDSARASGRRPRSNSTDCGSSTSTAPDS